MKPFYLLVFGILTLSVIACKKDQRPVKACGVEDPVKNLQWLKQKADSLKANTMGGRIMLFTYEGQDYFAVSLTPLSCAYCFWFSCDGTQINGPDDTTLINTVTIKGERKTVFEYGVR